MPSSILQLNFAGSFSHGGWMVPIVLPAALLGVILFALSGDSFAKQIGQAPRKVHLPGPRTIPLFGNLFKLRTGNARTLSHWMEKYGGIFRIALGSREAVVLNTHSAVAKTLVQQGVAFQSRPEFDLWHNAFAHGANDTDVPTLGTTKYSDKVSTLRRLLGPHTVVSKLPNYNRFVSRRYVRLIKLLEDVSRATMAGTGRDLGFALWTTAIGVSSDQLVGITQDEDIVKLICETEIDIFRQRNLAMPLHDYVPVVSWVEMTFNAVMSSLVPFFGIMGLPIDPGYFKAAEVKADKLRQAQVYYCKRQLEELHEAIAEGDETPSILGDLFRSLAKPLEPRDQFRLATTLSGSLMAAGTTLVWLTGKLADNPDMQEKALAAIQKEYGTSAPDPHDTDRVPYIKALGLEAGRFYSPIRLGFPRETHADAVVDNTKIPAGTIVIYNSFQINRDPSVYDYPDEFIPERWLDGHCGRTDTTAPPEKIGVPHLAHGAGRRMCMGIPNANKIFYGVLSLIIHFYKLERAPLDEEGKARVFPAFRAEVDEASMAMDPLDDQFSSCDAQAIARPIGIKLKPRKSDAVTKWLTEGCHTLDQLDVVV